MTDEWNNATGYVWDTCLGDTEALQKRIEDKCWGMTYEMMLVVAEAEVKAEASILLGIASKLLMPTNLHGIIEAFYNDVDWEELAYALMADWDKISWASKGN